jgi:hypothetical protein
MRRGHWTRPDLAGNIPPPMPAPEYPIPDLLKAVNEASGKAFALWITFLTVGVYLAIAIGTPTHLQLLLAGPVKLPLLAVPSSSSVASSRPRSSCAGGSPASPTTRRRGSARGPSPAGGRCRCGR